jgi:hypothetical protein
MQYRDVSPFDARTFACRGSDLAFSILCSTRLLVDVVYLRQHHNLGLGLLPAQVLLSIIVSIECFSQFPVIIEPSSGMLRFTEFAKARSCVCPLLDRAECAARHRGAPRMKSMGSMA